MAYRRSSITTTRAKLLYDQQRFAPSISHIHRHDDDRKNPESSSENPRLLTHLRHCYFGNRLCPGVGVAGIPFQDRKFSPPPPWAMAPILMRNMSTSVGEGMNKIEYMSGVAEVLSDKAVEAVASQAPVVNEVAVAAADSYLPVAALQYLIDYVHCVTGFNWWASIVCTTLLIRWLTLPLMIQQLKATSKLALLRPKLDDIRQEMQNRGMAPAAVNEGQQRMKELFNEHKVTPFAAFRGIFIQGPIFVSFFLAISNMAEKVPSFKEGGAFWFTDLTTPDSMYIFPVLTALTFWITVECNAQEGMEGNPSYGTIKNVSRAMAALSIPFTASFPKAVFCYWITSNIFSLSYGLVIKRPQVKKLLGVPIIPPAPPRADQSPGLPFFEAVKKLAAAKEYEAKQAAVEATKSASQEIQSTAVLSQKVRSLEKEVKGRKKGKKRR
nr:mitochondrial inner membrane protein OXA1-like [Ipomoea batatas]